ncbi:hypothetical protein G9A89_018633 [Geosiphon pyriformis]|nr:hypothetical protein G9A89_018633 [Geosiphon pyriformis]
MSDLWVCQYLPLNYVKDAFSDVMCLINMSELLLIVNGLSNGKATGLSVGSVVKDVLEKDQELWLILINKIITDFGLPEGYRVHDGLNQIQLESKLAAVVLFFNTPGIFDWLFHHRFLDLQVLNKFAKIQDGLCKVWSGSFEVYLDGLLRNAGFDGVVSGSAAYFLALDISIGVGVYGLASSTMVELQTVALSLEDKDFTVCWVKVKGHFEVYDNNRTDVAASVAVDSSFYLLMSMCEHFLMAEDTAVSGNTRYFVRDVFQFVCHA